MWLFCSLPVFCTGIIFACMSLFASLPSLPLACLLIFLLVCFSLGCIFFQDFFVCCSFVVIFFFAVFFLCLCVCVCVRVLLLILPALPSSMSHQYLEFWNLDVGTYFFFIAIAIKTNKNIEKNIAQRKKNKQEN